MYFYVLSFCFSKSKHYDWAVSQSWIEFFVLCCVQTQNWQAFSLVAVPGWQNPIFYAEEAAVGNVTVHFGEITPLTRNQIKQRII